MACACKDHNGSPSDLCLGMCSKFISLHEQQEHAALFGEKIANQITRFTAQIDNLQVRMHEAYKEGFKEGFCLGFQEGRESSSC
jgi:flagellar biosynthesis/type III secretory pathway protein FliH